MTKKIMIVFIPLALFLLFGGCGKDRVISLTPEICEPQGRNLADGEIPTPEDLAKDAYCAELMIQRNAPDGVITVFGSASAKEDWPTYAMTRRFAELWTKEMGAEYPILSGGGPGLMEAANRGAKEAGGKSLSFATYFGSGAEKPNAYITDGFMFASFAQREAEMVDRAAAIVVAPGGVGTEWEIFESLSKIQTGKKNLCPVILLGGKAVWKTLFDRLNHLKNIKTIKPHDIDLLSVAETPEAAVEQLKKYFAEKNKK
jgi:hypothetical protein